MLEIARTLVSHSRLIQPFGGKAGFLARAHEAALKVTGDPRPADQMVAQLADGLDKLAQKEKQPQVMHTAQHAAASLLQSSIAAQAIENGRLQDLHLEGDHPFDGFEVRFSSDDWLGWAASFFTWWRGIEPHEMPAAPARALPVPNRLRVALVGDWGSGLYGAPFCAQSIEDDPDGYDLLLHLGDIYYSGTHTETAERFLELWPLVPTAVSRALNGNHEMYTGGYAYFDDVLPRFDQASSYFAFQNDYWTLVGLDTAYEDHSLTLEQVAWLRRILADAGGRKVVVFSHHQPFSLLDEQGPSLVERMREFLVSKRITAWYWGHEHRAVLYDAHPQWGFLGRCVGHGGFPEYRLDDVRNAPTVPGVYDGWKRLDCRPDRAGVPGAMVLDSANVYIAGFESHFGPHGYMRLDFDRADLHESVRAPQGANLYDRKLPL